MQWPIGYGVGLRIKRSSVRIRPWPLRWVLGQGSLLPLSQGEAFTLASISYLAILVKYILAKKKKKKAGVVHVCHSSHKFATQSSHSVDRAGCHAKMATLEFWIPWRSADPISGIKFKVNVSFLCRLSQRSLASSLGGVHHEWVRLGETQLLISSACALFFFFFCWWCCCINLLFFILPSCPFFFSFVVPFYCFYFSSSIGCSCMSMSTPSVVYCNRWNVRMRKNFVL